VSQSWTIYGITVGTLGQRDALRAATAEEIEGILVLLRGGTPTLDAIELVLGEITEPYVDPDPPSDPVPPSVKLYRYATRQYEDVSVPPVGLNYVTGIDGRLHPTNAVMVDGEVRQIDYYAEATMDPATGQVSYDDLVVRESFVYQRDAVGFARGRVQTITWYREDDTPHPTTKQRVKFYEPDESLREGYRRRGNITDKLAMDMAGWLMVTQTQLANQQDRLNLGREFMRQHKLSFDMFVEASSAQILYDVTDDTTDWLDDLLAPGVTIRATILDALNIWNLTL
jgi:hypothetical protein